MLKKKKKNFIKPNFRFLQFRSGDILSVYYKVKGLGFNFTGICISVNKKFLKDINSSFTLRNIIIKIAVECNFSLYGVFKLNYSILEFAKKCFFYKKSKLYYLKDHINQSSFVKW